MRRDGVTRADGLKASPSSATSSAQSSTHRGVYGKKDGASFQVIVLGASGGPKEDNATGLLVRSTASAWRKGSVVAVDAGAHLAKMVRVLQDKHHLPLESDGKAAGDPTKVTALVDGPFAGVECSGVSARAKALYIFRQLLHSFLITHPHLDHISAMAINTPALEFGREPKAIVALPSVIDAVKTHIFNDVIWPNLSDEDDGVGFLTYRRLIEGGNPRLGAGEGRGYVNVCEGLATKCWSVSHGRCKRTARHSSVSHARDGAFGFGPAFSDSFSFSGRRFSHVSDAAAASATASNGHCPSVHHQPAMATAGPALEPACATHEAVDSSAFFIRNHANGDEIIVWGDVEPDSLSLLPRNQTVWEDAAAKMAAGSLRAIFIECSFDDSARDQDLYGHLCPRHLIAELAVLAEKVALVGRGSEHDAAIGDQSPEPDATAGTKAAARSRSRTGVRKRKRARQSSTPPPQSNRHRRDRSEATDPCPASALPLQSLTVHIIHVKDPMTDNPDGPSRAELIQSQLTDAGRRAALGCTFHVTSDGESIWV